MIAWDLTVAESDGTDRYIVKGFAINAGNVSISIDGGVKDASPGGGLTTYKKTLAVSDVAPSALTVPDAADTLDVAALKAILNWLNAQGHIGAGALSVA